MDSKGCDLAFANLFKGGGKPFDVINAPRDALPAMSFSCVSENSLSMSSPTNMPCKRRSSTPESGQQVKECVVE